MSANSFGSSQSITVDRDNQLITVTSKTVRFGSSVYQTHNIASFTEGKIAVSSIPWIFIILVFIIGIASLSFNSLLGVMLIFVAISGIFWNDRPKQKGLLITLNSGDKMLFVAQAAGLDEVIANIYTLIEMEKEGSYKISITNSQISGNLVQGNIGGDATYKSGK
jgi:Family of unknown function (DUF6232)